jgi:small-conductance mechanosensitive channel
MQASWRPTVSKGHLLAALGLVWLLIACVWLYTYSTAPLRFRSFFLLFIYLFFKTI